MKLSVKPCELALLKLAVFLSLGIIIGTATDKDCIDSTHWVSCLGRIVAASFFREDTLFVLTVNLGTFHLGIGRTDASR